MICGGMHYVSTAKSEKPVSLRQAVITENYEGAEAALAQLEHEISEQAASAFAIMPIQGAIRSVVERAVADADAAKVEAAAAQRDAALAKSDLNAFATKVRELEAKFDRLCEHRLHHEHVRERVWAMTDGKCFYCHVELLKDSTCEGNPRHVFEVDHLVPKSLGGPDHLANFVPACAGCNGEKSNKPFVEFYMARRPAPVLSIVEAPAA